jgi:hypothetical protein
MLAHGDVPFKPEGRGKCGQESQNPYPTNLMSVKQPKKERSPQSAVAQATQLIWGLGFRVLVNHLLGSFEVVMAGVEAQLQPLARVLLRADHLQQTLHPPHTSAPHTPLSTRVCIQRFLLAIVSLVCPLPRFHPLPSDKSPASEGVDLKADATGATALSTCCVRNSNTLHATP